MTKNRNIYYKKYRFYVVLFFRSTKKKECTIQFGTKPSNGQQGIFVGNFSSCSKKVLTILYIVHIT